jgi:hypothetical protein
MLLKHRLLSPILDFVSVSLEGLRICTVNFCYAEHPRDKFLIPYDAKHLRCIAKWHRKQSAH